MGGAGVAAVGGPARRRRHHARPASGQRPARHTVHHTTASRPPSHRSLHVAVHFQGPRVLPTLDADVHEGRKGVHVGADTLPPHLLQPAGGRAGRQAGGVRVCAAGDGPVWKGTRDKDTRHTPASGQLPARRTFISSSARGRSRRTPQVAIRLVYVHSLMKCGGPRLQHGPFWFQTGRGDQQNE